MTEKYLLEEPFPAIPCPHDCEVKEIRAEDEYLLLVFDEDIALHDSIQDIRPQARSLVIRVRLYSPGDFMVYKRFGRMTGFRFIDEARVLGRQQKRVEYLNHYIKWHGIIIVLSEYVISAEASAVELIWTDR